MSTEFQTGPRILVCGGRDYEDQAHVFRVLNILNPSTIMHGACGWNEAEKEKQLVETLRGADRWADQFARLHDIPLLRWPANWTKFGPGAGPKRNRFMLVDWKPDLVVAFPGGDGTASCVNEARKRKILVWVDP